MMSLVIQLAAWLCVLVLIQAFLGCEASNEQFTYEITNSLLNWTEARQRCLQVGGDLASVLSAEDQSKVAALMVNHGNYWIGLNDRTTEGTFVWSDGNAVSFQNWAPGEPNDHEHDEDCATAVYGKLSDYEYHKNWNDLACWNRLKSICKIPGPYWAVQSLLPQLVFVSNINFADKRLLDYTSKTVNVASLKACFEVCSKMKPLHCLSLNYKKVANTGSSTHACELNMKKKARDDHKNFISDKDYVYYEVDG